MPLFRTEYGAWVGFGNGDVGVVPRITDDARGVELVLTHAPPGADFTRDHEPRVVLEFKSAEAVLTLANKLQWLLSTLELAEGGNNRG